MKNRNLIGLMIFVVAVVASCESDDGDDTNTEGSNEPSIEDFEPTFTNVETQIFAKSCTFSSCHGVNAAGDLDLTSPSYDRLVDVESAMAPGKILVVPGDPAASYLIEKLEQTAPAMGEKMPLNGELEPERIQFVKDWILAGANND
ncbi:MAG: hypothetical protein HUU55_10645 [Myxococcales bacterium]|nr:hypothetical protein [Myxococcales bacterium]